MKHTTFIFAGIMSAIIGNAFAAGENTVTSKSYVDAQDALKQDLINAEMMTLVSGSGGKAQTRILPTLVSYDNTDNLTGTKYGIGDTYDDFVIAQTNTKLSEVIPTMNFLKNQLDLLQYMIPASGFSVPNGEGTYNTNAANIKDSWLSADVAGTGLVTRTDTDGIVGERKIFEASDLSGYSALTGNNKSIADISIPTVGAMMSAISSGATAALPTGTTGTVVTYNGATNGIQQFTETAIASSATHNPQTGALTNGSDIANVTLVETEIATRQAKMTCAGWPDSVAVADRTDENCWLWNKN